MDGKSEQKENSFSGEIVRLDEKFQLFNPYRTHLERDQVLYTEIGLDTGILPRLGFWLKLERIEPINRTIHPSDPKKGYLITNEDFDPKKREDKIKKIIHENKEQRPSIEDWDFDSVFLDSPDVMVATDMSPDPRLFDLDKGKFKFKPEVLSIVKRLRLHLFFPNSTFEGQPTDANLQDGKINFWEFHPTDSGPMAPVRLEWGALSIGMPVSFPNDIKYIQDVNGMFVLDPKTE